MYTNVTVYNRFDALGQIEEREGLVRFVVSQISTSDTDRECWDRTKGALVARGYESFVNSVELSGQ
jgi:hypothetical protein